MIANFEELQQYTAGVVLWSGLLSNLPSGWVLCDGNNGTPDLTNQFLRGVETVDTTPGTTGGKDTISLSSSQMPSHSHSGSTDSVGNHGHSGSEGDDNSADMYNGNAATTDGYFRENNDTSFNGSSTGGGGNHSHSLNINSAGGGGSYDNRPPFYEVAYIQKL